MLEKKLDRLGLRLQKHGHIVLPEGCAQKRIVLQGLRGTAERPLILEGALVGDPPARLDYREAPQLPDVIDSEPAHQQDREKFATKLSSEHSADTFKPVANRIALRRQEGGHYPTIAEIADQAVLTLVDCQHVVIKNIAFENCWPTAIYMDNCQFISLDQLRFDGSTYCIGASGRNTHDIVVQNCRYRGNPRLWKEIGWKHVHGAHDVGHPVDIGEDYRHLDGDFFRGWDIFGNVTIRYNWIGDCFNAVHFFTKHSGRRRDIALPPYNKRIDAYEDGGATNALDLIAGINILIENNVFYRVRDNCVEPEAFGYNWVVRYNRMDNCYKPFSLGLKQTGWFYIYGNTGSLNERPGLEGDNHGAPSLMKLPKRQNRGGPVYMVHNSWFLSKKHLNKRMMRGLKHFNNAIEFDLSNSGDPATKPGSGGMFGAGPWVPLPPVDQKDPSQNRSFTRQWSHLEITVDGDICNDHFVNRHHKDGTSEYQRAGYALGLSMHYTANVLKSSGGDLFELTKHAKEIQTPVSMRISLPHWHNAKVREEVEIPAGEYCGALTSDGLYDPFIYLKDRGLRDFPFLPNVEHQEFLTAVGDANGDETT